MTEPAREVRTWTRPDPEATGRLVLEQWWLGMNPHTRRSFGAAYRQAVVFLGGTEYPAGTQGELQAMLVLARHFASVSPAEAYSLALAWRNHLQAAGLAPGSINRRLTALRSLTNRLSLAGLLSYQLTLDRAREELYRDTAGPGAEGIRALLDTTCRGLDADIRDRAILRLLADLALRRAELTGLDLGDVDLTRGAIWITRKGRSQKTRIDLSPKAQEELRAWLDLREFLPTADADGRHPLFVPINRHGQLRPQRLTGTGVYLIVRGRGLRGGVKARPHGIRHTSAVTALRVTGGNLEAVRELLGHQGYQAARHYLREMEGLQRQVSERISGEW